MSTQQFISESRTLLRDQENELKRYLDILSKINTGKLNMIDTFKEKLIDKLKDLIFGKALYDENSEYWDPIMDDAANSSVSGDTSDDEAKRQARHAMALLGSILASNPNAIFYFIKQSGDSISSTIDDRSALVNSIKDRMQILKDNLNGIDSAWYTEYMESVENSQYEVNDAISDLLTVRAQSRIGIINEGEMNVAKTKLNVAIEYLSKPDQSSSFFDITTFVGSLASDLQALTDYDEIAIDSLESLRNSKEDFVANVVGNNRFVNYFSEAMEYQYNSLKSISISMQAVVDSESSIDGLTQSGSWISGLYSIIAGMDLAIVDYTESISDSSNANTIILDDMLYSLDQEDRYISEELSDLIEKLLNIAGKKISNDISLDEFNVLFAEFIEAAEADTIASVNISSDTRTYSPEVIPAVTELLRFVNSMDMDRLKALLLDSKWGEIFKLKDDALSYTDTILNLINSFIDTVVNDEVKTMLQDFYYTLQSDKKMRNIMALTFDSLKDDAISDITNNRLRGIDELKVQLDVLEEKL